MALGGNKLRGLLAVLLLHANKPVSAERLAVALWGEDAPGRATNTVQVHIGRLRKALGDAKLIATMPAGYCLRVGPDELDSVRFERLVALGRRALADGQPDQAAVTLDEALALWRGPPLEELANEPFANAEITRLEEQHLAALETRIDADLATGRHNELIGELRRLVAVNPTRERLTEQLMLALYRCGRQTDALETFQEARGALIADVGVEPGPRLRELQDAILRQDPVLEPSRVPLQPVANRASVSPPVSRDDKPVVLVLPRSLHVSADSAFVGRDRELGRLREHWTRIQAGGRSAVVIAGEPGMGKTRLASELAHEVHEQGALVLYGRCDEGLAVPYQPFVEALRSLLPMIDVDQLRAQLGGLAPELGRLLPELTDVGSPASADAESARFALFEAVVALLELMTARQHTLLVIDDVQWAAPATLLLLRHLIRSERRLALLIVVTFRSTELQPDEPLAQLLADLQRDNSAERVALSGLDEQAIGTLLKVAVGPALADQVGQLVANVHAETAGNPFFVCELVAHLLETDALRGTGHDSGRAFTPAKLDIPDGLRGVICHRVARLSEPARQLMTIASVATGAIDVWLVESVLSESGALLDALDEAVTAGLLVERGRGEFDFTHALVRQAVHDDLSMARRLHLHRRLGEALEARDDAHEHAEALAHHFAQLAPDGEMDKATSYAIAAGHAATARLAYEDAAAHFQRGLDLLARTQETDGRRHVDLLLGLGHSCWSTGNAERARGAFKHAAEIAHTLDDAAAAADAALGFSGPFYFGVETSASCSEVLLQRALAMLDEPDSALRARLMGRLAASRAYAAGQHDHRVLAYDALAMARQANDKHALVDVLATCYWVTRGTTDPDRELQIARELTRLAEEVGDLQGLAYGRAWVSGHLLEQGEIRGVLRELDELQRVVQSRNDRYGRWLLAALGVMLAHIKGQLDSVESLAVEAIGHWSGGPELAAPAQVFATQMFLLRREQGRLDELVDLASANVDQSPDFAPWRCALAHIYAELGDRESARRELQLLGDLARLRHDAFWLASITMAGMAAVFLDDHNSSHQAYDLLLPHADTCLVTLAFTCEGSTSRPLGMLATTLERYDDAERHFEDALDMNARVRSPLWTAHTQYEYARLLRLRATPGDRDRARTLLAAATATANTLGLPMLSRRASAEAHLLATD